MRIALLSALATNDSDPGELYCGRILLVRSILQRQIEAAISLGCGHIICHALNSDPAIVSGQKHADRVGIKFVTIANPMALSGQVTTADELLVIADGLLFNFNLVAVDLTRRHGILTFPAKDGVAAGFERIDAHTAWAGILITPGSSVERLMQLDKGSNPASALLRISLQAGLPIIPLDATVLSKGKWAIDLSNARLKQVELENTAHGIPKKSMLAPGAGIVRVIARATAIPAIQAGYRSQTGHAVSAFLITASMALSWFVGPIAGLIVFILAGLSVNLASDYRQVLLYDAGESTEGDRSIIRDVLFDLALIWVLCLPLIAAQNEWRDYVLIVIMVASIRIAHDAVSEKVAQLWRDRISLAAVLAVAVAFQLLLPIIAFITLVSLMAVLILPIKSITQGS